MKNFEFNGQIHASQIKIGATTLSEDGLKEIMSGSTSVEQATISGIWMFPEGLLFTDVAELHLSQSVGFTSNGISFDTMTVKATDYGDWHNLNYVYNNGTDPILVNGASGGSCYWEDPSYRSVDFGTEPQTISAEFLAFMKQYATQITGIKADPVEQLQKDVSGLTGDITELESRTEAMSLRLNTVDEALGAATVTEIKEREHNGTYAYTGSHLPYAVIMKIGGYNDYGSAVLGADFFWREELLGSFRLSPAFLEKYPEFGKPQDSDYFMGEIDFINRTYSAYEITFVLTGEEAWEPSSTYSENYSCPELAVLSAGAGGATVGWTDNAGDYSFIFDNDGYFGYSDGHKPRVNCVNADETYRGAYPTKFVEYLKAQYESGNPVRIHVTNYTAGNSLKVDISDLYPEPPMVYAVKQEGDTEDAVVQFVREGGAIIEDYSPTITLKLYKKAGA